VLQTEDNDWVWSMKWRVPGQEVDQRKLGEIVEKDYQMEEGDTGWLMTMIGVREWMFLLVRAHLGCPGQNPESCKTFSLNLKPVLPWIWIQIQIIECPPPALRVVEWADQRDTYSEERTMNVTCACLTNDCTWLFDWHWCAATIDWTVTTHCLASRAQHCQMGGALPGRRHFRFAQWSGTDLDCQDLHCAPMIVHDPSHFAVFACHASLQPPLTASDRPVWPVNQEWPLIVPLSLCLPLIDQMTIACCAAPSLRQV